MTINFATTRKPYRGNTVNQMSAIALNLTDGLWSHNETSSVVILHPERVEKCLEMQPRDRSEDVHYWISTDEVSAEYYYGDNKTLVICCMK